MKARPKTQTERSKASAEKRQRLGEAELRHLVPRHTREMLCRLMRWHGVTQQAEAMQLLILNAHALGKQGSAPLFAERLGDGPRNEEELRHRLRPGPLRLFEELMLWHGITDDADAAERLVRNAHAMGREESAALLSPPRHEIRMRESVAQNLYERGSRTARQLDQEDPDNEADDELGLPVRSDHHLPHGPAECSRAQIDIFNDTKEPAA